MEFLLSMTMVKAGNRFCWAVRCFTISISFLLQSDMRRWRERTEDTRQETQRQYVLVTVVCVVCGLQCCLLPSSACNLCVRIEYAFSRERGEKEYRYSHLLLKSSLWSRGFLADSALSHNILQICRATMVTKKAQSALLSKTDLKSLRSWVDQILLPNDLLLGSIMLMKRLLGKFGVKRMKLNSIPH